jgi:hypothetical protein
MAEGHLFIEIGGDIPESLLPEFIAALNADHPPGFPPFTVEDVKRTLRTPDQTAAVLFYEFDTLPEGVPRLEDWLRAHEIPYCRQSDRGQDYDEVRVNYRPECGSVVSWLDADGIGFVHVHEVRPIRDVLAEVVKHPAQGDAIQLLRQALEEFDQVLPKKVPPLPPFRIVPDLDVYELERQALWRCA